MNKEAFIDLVLLELPNYVVAWALSFTFLFIILKSSFKSFLHPLFFYYVVIYSFIYAAVIFLYNEEIISTYYVKYFLISQAAFLIGFLIVKLSKCRPLTSTPTTQELKSRDKFIYNACIIIFVSFTLLTYSYFGIPALSASRWELYQSIPGAGLIGRVVEASKLFLIFYLTFKILSKNIKSSFLDKLLVLLLIVSGFLSGSKFSLAEYIFFAYLACFFLKRQNFDVKEIQISFRVLLFLGLGVVASLFIVYINQLYVNDNKVNPIYLLMRRFVMSADLHIMVYAYDIIEDLTYEYSNIFEILLLDLKSLISLFGMDFQARSIGIYAMYYHYPYLDGVVNTGPASNFDVFYFYHFGYYGGILFSFFTGVIIAVNLFSRSRTRKLSSIAFRTIVTYSLFTLILNPQMAIGKIVIAFVFYTILTLMYELTAFKK